MARYAIGIDFGTESARAVLVDLSDGREVAEAVYAYPDGVIDERLPGADIRLDPDWALQNPADYVAAVKDTLPRLLAQSRVSPDEVIGIGIDFTACTILPTLRDGTPLCALPAYRNNPHAWLRRQDLLGVVFPQGVADSGRGPRDLCRRRAHHRGR